MARKKIKTSAKEETRSAIEKGDVRMMVVVFNSYYLRSQKCPMNMITRFYLELLVNIYLIVS
jgi:hypothetical protein